MYRVVTAILRCRRYGSHIDLPLGHPIMIIEINVFLCEKLILMFIMGCPGGKINMAAVSAKRSIETTGEALCAFRNSSQD